MWISFGFIPLEIHWASRNCKLMFYYTFWKLLVITSSSIFFCPFFFLIFQNSHYKYIGILNLVPQVSEALIIFLQWFFSLFFRFFFSTDISSFLVRSSHTSNLLLNRSTEFFISVTIPFNSRIFILFVFIVCFLTEISYLLSHCHHIFHLDIVF